MKALKLTVIACSLAVCAGCTMAPKYERPAAPVAATFPTGEAYKDVMTTASPTGRSSSPTRKPRKWLRWHLPTIAI